MSNDKRNINDLYAAFDVADGILLKKYVAKLSQSHCIELSDEFKKLKTGENVSLYRIARLVYDKNENIQDKLTTVYSTVFSLENCGIAMLINGHKDHTDLYIGVINRNLRAIYKSSKSDSIDLESLKAEEILLSSNGKALKNALIGNFPGTELIPINNFSVDCESADGRSKSEIITDSLNGVSFVSAVSSIPALRNTNERKSAEFIQGLEKLIDTMRGKEYSAFIIADAMSNEKIESICAEYEDIYSQLVPFKQSTQTISTSKGSTDTEGLVKGVTDTTNESIAKSLTHGTAFSKTNTDSIGGTFGSGMIFPVSASANYSHAWSRTNTESKGEADTRTSGTSKSLTEQNSVSKSLSTTNGESIQVTYENRAVKSLLDRIDEQIKRLRSCEDFGMFDACAYFVSGEYDTVAIAASAFKSITRGENSSIEASSVNIWKDEEDVKYIKEYLQRFYHPEFVSPILSGEYFKEKHCSVTPALLISGREMAYQMSMPKKSVSGIPVVECAEFGREVVAMNNKYKATLPLGNVYHMRCEDKNTTVNLNTKALTAHTFITGTTGSGKTTTVYKMLNELSRKVLTGTEERIKFLVIEPAKGEYKNYAKELSANVYGTNPKLSPLLRINPFRFPSDKIHIYEHMDKLTEIFNVCWPMYAAMPAVLKASIENAYRNAGWNLVSSKNKYGDIYPSFIDVALEVEKYVNKSQYSEENKSNYKGSLLTRLESLTNGINSMIFTSDDIDDEVLFNENSIVDLSRVGSVETKALIMGILVLKLQEYRISTAVGSNSELRHVTVLEEAHNLLKRTSTEQSSETANLLGKSVEMLSNSIAEMRTYGEGFIIADQAPGLLDLSVIRNTNTKIIMQLPEFSDRELVGKAAGLKNDQIDELAKLPCGIAAVYQTQWISPVLCKIDRPSSNEEPYSFDNSKETFGNAKSIVFDMLDNNFRSKIDDIDEEMKFKQKIFKADLPIDAKVKILTYMRERNSTKYFNALSKIIYDYFENSKEILETMVADDEIKDVDTLKQYLLNNLIPTMTDCDDEQQNIILMLIMKEHIERFHVDMPVWNDFALKLARGEVR